MELTIQKGVPKPDDLSVRTRSDAKYAPHLAKMEVGDYIEVPKEMYFGDEPFREEGYNGKKHRTNVYNAVRGWALTQNTAESKKPDYNAETFKPIKFTVALLKNGNVGIWRDQ
jgi:hypothetical protein